MLEYSDTRDAPQRLIFYVLLVFVVLNLLQPGESSTLTLVLSQVVIFGFTGLYVLFIRPRIEVSMWVLPAVFFGLALLVSQYCSMHAYGSLRTGLQMLSMVLLAWLVAEMSPERRSLLIAMGSLVAIAAVLSAVGLLQLLTFFDQPLDLGLANKFIPLDQNYFNLIYGQKRIFSTFILPTSFSVFLAIVFPLAGALAIQFKEKLLVVSGCGVAMLLMTLAMLQAQSNGGPVALAAGCVATALLYAKDRKLPLKWIIPALLVIGILLIAGIGFIRGNFLWDLGARNSPIRLRWNLWVATLAMISRHGLFGIGAGNFELAYFPFVEQDVRASKFAHNTYLQIPLELGVLGLVALVAALSLVVVTILRNSRSRLSDPFLKYGIIAAAIVFLVANSFEIVLYYQSLGLLGSLIVGLALGRIRKREEQQPAESKRQLKPSSVVIALGCIAAMLLLGRWFLADHYYERANSQRTLNVLNSESQNGGSRDNSQLEGGEEIDSSVEDLVRTAIIIDPTNYRYHFFLAGILEERGDAENSTILDAYAEAARLCPGLPYLHYNYGMALARRGSLLQAAQEIAEAERLNPISAEYKNTRKLVEERLQALLRGAQR